jgi:AAA15 family ATPase/GTPase
MYTNFRIQNFRGFKDLELKDLARVNLIAGKNNVGKTSLLEALFIHTGGYVVERVLRIQYFRGIHQNINQFGEDAPWKLLLHNLSNDSVTRLEGHFEDREGYKVKLKELSQPQEIKTFTDYARTNNPNSQDIEISLTDPKLRVLELENITDEKSSKYYLYQSRGGIKLQNPPESPIDVYYLPATGRIPPNEVAELYGELARIRQEKIVLQILQFVEPRLDSLQIIPIQGIPMLYGNIGLTEDIPIASMGDGLNRIANLVLSMSSIKDGVILIDEIENGLHYSVQTDVWRAIAKAAEQFNVQIFATTHSHEMIVAAHEAFKETEDYNFRFLRLDRNRETQDITAVRYSDNTIDAAIRFDSEVRG